MWVVSQVGGRELWKAIVKFAKDNMCKKAFQTKDFKNMSEKYPISKVHFILHVLDPKSNILGLNSS